MTEQTYWETIEAKGGAILDKVKDLIEAGNVRRVRVSQKGRVIAEFPLTIGVVGAVLAPALAAIGALLALATDCVIDVEKTTADPPVQSADAPRVQEPPTPE
jgi:hypothetical protein